VAAGLVLALACGGGGPDLEAEARDVRWDLLSGAVAYARWEPSPVNRAYIFVLEPSTRTVSLLRDVPASITGWARDLAFRPDGTTLTYAVQGSSGLWELHDLQVSTGSDSVLFSDRTAHLNYPSWTGDAGLAFFRNGESGAFEALNGAFLASDVNPSRVAWRPDGRLFMSAPDLGSPGELYLFDPVSGDSTVEVAASGSELLDQPALTTDGAAGLRPARPSGGRWRSGLQPPEVEDLCD
jgi:hypothetical protein